MNAKRELRELVEEHTIGIETFRLERVRCGHSPCKCERGELHGPYWYGYRRVDGRMVSRYIGKLIGKDPPDN